MDLVKRLFTGMGLLAFLIGGLTVFVGERLFARCAPAEPPEMEAPAQP